MVKGPPLEKLPTLGGAGVSPGGPATGCTMEKKYTSMKKGIGNGRDKRCALVSGGSSCCALALARLLREMPSFLASDM